MAKPKTAQKEIDHEGMMYQKTDINLVKWHYGCFLDIFREASILFFLNPSCWKQLSYFFTALANTLNEVYSFRFRNTFHFSSDQKGLYNTVVIAAALTRH